MPARLDFRSRHLGPVGSDRDEMLKETGYRSLAALIDAAVPAGIRMDGALGTAGSDARNTMRSRG